jgi:hypothetical protein
MLKKIDIFWSIYLAHRCFKFDVSIDDIIDVSKILRIPNLQLFLRRNGRRLISTGSCALHLPIWVNTRQEVIARSKGSAEEINSDRKNRLIII